MGHALSGLRLGILIGLWFSLACAAQAEAPGAPWVTVLRPSGEVLAVMRCDGGQYHSEPQSDDAEHWPYVKTLLTSTDAPSRPDAGSQKLPTMYKGQPVVAVPWLLTPRGGVLTYLFLGKTQKGQEPVDGPGVFAVVDGHSGSILHTLPPRFNQYAADRSIYWRPTIAVAKQCALVCDDGITTAYDLDRGQKLWTLPAASGDVRGLDGAWYFEGALYLSTTRGLCRVDPVNGHVVWCIPAVGAHMERMVMRDGVLYVLAYYPPPTVTEALKTAATGRYGSPPRDRVVVPYKTSFFGLTQRTDKLNDVWEFKKGRWSWIFAYDSAQSESARDRVFAKYQFSSHMRQRLEHFD